MFTDFFIGLGIAGGTATVAGLLARRWPRGQVVSSALDDTQERLDLLLVHLRELDDQAQRFSGASLLEERTRVEQQAANLMKERERLVGERSKKQKSGTVHAEPVAGFFVQRPRLAGAMWGAGAIAVLGMLWVMLSNQGHVESSGGGMMGQGSPPMGMAGGQPGGGAAADSEVAELIAKLEKQPNDVDALVRLAHVALRGQMLDEARSLTDRAMKLSPDNTEAQVHDAVLTASVDATSGNAKLDALVKKDSRLAEAWFFRGMLAMQSGDQPRMKESFRQFVDVAPPGPQRDRIAAMLAKASE